MIIIIIIIKLFREWRKVEGYWQFAPLFDVPHFLSQTFSFILSASGFSKGFCSCSCEASKCELASHIKKKTALDQNNSDKVLSILYLRSWNCSSWLLPYHPNAMCTKHIVSALCKHFVLNLKPPNILDIAWDTWEASLVQRK